MPDQLQLRGGTTAQHASFTGASKEVTVDTTKKTLVVHDGSTAGGNPLLREDQSNLPTTAPTRGIYNASGSLAISAGGSGRLFVDASGNVAIGSANYTGRLSLPINSTISWHNAGTQNQAIWADSSGNLLLYTANGERLRITSAGLVGIGTSSPSTTTEIRGSGNTVIASNGNLFVADGGTATQTAGEGGQISFGAWLNGDTSAPYAMAAIKGITESSTTNVNAGALLFGSRDTSSGIIERMRIDSSGRVGIGTTTPSAKLHVADTVDNAGPLFENTGARASITVKSAATTYSSYVNFGNPSGNSRAFIDFKESSGYLGLATSFAGGYLTFSTDSQQERLRIDSSGRLLVGTSSGSGNNLLQIQGEAGSSAGIGGIVLRRGLAPSLLGSGSIMGRIDFGPNDGGVGASIIGEGDAQQGTNDYPSRLVFSVTRDGQASPTEAMRIRSDGAALFLSEANNGIVLGITGSSGTSNRLFSAGHSASGIGVFTETFLVWSNGDVRNTNNSYGAISDLKLKENIVDANSQWSDIKALQVRNYNFKEGQTHTQIGLIAQEAELVSPGLVSESPDRDAEGNDLGTVTKSVNYSVLYMKAVKALQEAMERIETLEAKVAALESA